ncbi:uncharacterized protein G2W53_043132 [Senna tora]|uniref:Uncharacterized protein n=1 Tax=Senna tora TaxID=362788 RepID=A0A834W339_9FABA|nr:uncharacterized protein G2W53_043132 [Senna tora]
MEMRVSRDEGEARVWVLDYWGNTGKKDPIIHGSPGSVGQLNRQRFALLYITRFGSH